MSKDTEEVGHLVPPALDFHEMRPDVFGGFRSRYIADKRHERCPLVLWALDCPPHVVGSTRPGGSPFGRCPLALPNSAPFSLRWYQMIILAGAERGIQGVSGPVVRSEDAATCRREHRPSTSAPKDHVACQVIA